jgi:outer membrane protein
MRLVSVIYFAFVIVTGIKAQWSWDRCLAYAFENNPDILITDIYRQKQEISLHSAKYAFFPTAGAGAGYSFNSGNSIDPSTNIITNDENWKNSYGIEASISLFQGFVRVNRVKFEKYNLELASEEVELQKNRVAFEVISFFTVVLFYDGMQEIASEQMAISKRTWEKNNRMFELGLSPQSDVIESEARLAQDSLNAIQMEIQLATQLLSLKRMMNYPLFDTLQLEGIAFEKMLLEATALTEDEIMAAAKSHLPQIAMLQSSLQAARAQVAMARGNVLPNLSLKGSWSSGYYSTNHDNEGNITPFQAQMEGNANVGFGLSLHIPIFNRLSNYQSIKDARLNQKLAEAQYQKGLSNEEYNIYSSILELDAAKKAYLAAQKNNEKQELAFNTAAKQLEKGLIDLIAFSTVKNQYAQARMDYLRSQLQLFIKAKTIQFYITGKII